MWRCPGCWRRDGAAFASPSIARRIARAKGGRPEVRLRETRQLPAKEMIGFAAALPVRAMSRGISSMSYNAFKVIHLLGVVLFLGNIIVTALWKMLADRTREPAVIAYAQWLVTLTDWIFSAGGVVLILIGAYGMAGVGSLALRQTWLVWGQSLFLLSGLIWVAVLIPTQIAQARQARAFAAGGPIPESYWRLGRRWAIWGVIATIVPLCNLYFMVFKP